jgi:hypothetical protein
MKAITIKQPWASLIIERRRENLSLGIKDIENRTWPCPKKYIGQRVLVHASTNSDKRIAFTKPQYEYIQGEGYEPYGNFNIMCYKLRGAIIGSVQIIACVMNHPSIWAEKTAGVTDINTHEFIPRRNPKPIYNWVLANPIKFPEPIPAKGKLRFWEYPNILAEPEEEEGELFCHCQLPVKLKNQVMSYADELRCRYCGGKWYR